MKVLRMRETTCVARRECPPKAKKSLSNVRSERRKTSLQIEATISSVGEAVSDSA